MNDAKENFLQAVKETICILDGHKYKGGDIKEIHIDEYETTCFTFKCARCEKHVACAVKDSDLSYTYPLETEFDFNERKEDEMLPMFTRWSMLYPRG